ncbi:MAG: FYVE zinc finger domain-containing protein, partial [Pseudomonadota bacterium]
NYFRLMINPITYNAYKSIVDILISAAKDCKTREIKILIKGQYQFKKITKDFQFKIKLNVKSNKKDKIVIYCLNKKGCKLLQQKIKAIYRKYSDEFDTIPLGYDGFYIGCAYELGSQFNTSHGGWIAFTITIAILICHDYRKDKHTMASMIETCLVFFFRFSVDSAWQPDYPKFIGDIKGPSSLLIKRICTLFGDFYERNIESNSLKQSRKLCGRLVQGYKMLLFGKSIKGKKIYECKWTSDEKADHCELCKQRLGYWQKSNIHHCRICGRAICTSCVAVKSIRNIFPLKQETTMFSRKGVLDQQKKMCILCAEFAKFFDEQISALVEDTDTYEGRYSGNIRLQMLLGLDTTSNKLVSKKKVDQTITMLRTYLLRMIVSPLDYKFFYTFYKANKLTSGYVRNQLVNASNKAINHAVFIFIVGVIIEFYFTPDS